MNIVNNVKEIATIIKKIDDAELYKKILDLRGEIIDLTEERRKAEEKVRQLEELLNLNEKMEYKSPFWFKAGDETPFCPRCWENDKNDIHLIELSGGRFDCPQCHNRLMTDDNQGVRGVRFGR